MSHGRVDWRISALVLAAALWLATPMIVEAWHSLSSPKNFSTSSWRQSTDKRLYMARDLVRSGALIDEDQAGVELLLGSPSMIRDASEELLGTSDSEASAYLDLPREAASKDVGELWFYYLGTSTLDEEFLIVVFSRELRVLSVVTRES